MSTDRYTSPFIVVDSDSSAADEPKMPPANIEAEQALLGALLLNNDALTKVSDYLQAEHFYQPVHGRIFDAIAKLVGRNQIADAITLKQYFDADGALADIGGAQYLARLTTSAVSIVTVGDYGRTIYDLALKRQLIQIGEEIAETAQNQDLESDAINQIEEAEQHLFALAETGNANGGFQDFRQVLKGALQLADAAWKREGSIVGVATNLKDLDNKLGGLHPSDLIILAGRPAMGKSSLATNIAFDAAKLHHTTQGQDGAVVGFFSLEMSAEQLATRILAEQIEISSDKIRRGDLKEQHWDKLVEVSNQLANIPLFIDDTPALSIAGLRTRARRLKRLHGLDMVVVDYLQLLRGSTVENRVLEIGEISRGLKALAKELDIPVLALSQLSRAVEARDDKRPQLADLRESGTIEQDSDVVMFVYREEYYHERKEPEPDTAEHLSWREKAERIHGIAEVIIGKQRHGPTGTVKLQFEREFTKFRNLAANHYLEDETY